MTKITLDAESSQSLYRYVTASREGVKKEWKERFDRNLELFTGAHWERDDGRGLKQVVDNMILETIDIKNSAQTDVPPVFTATPKPQDEPEDAIDLEALLAEPEEPAIPTQEPPLGIPMGEPDPYGLNGILGQPPQGMEDAAQPNFDAMLAGPPPKTPEEEQFERELPLILSERVTQVFHRSGAWETARAVLLDKRVFGIGISMVGIGEGEEQPLSKSDQKFYAEQMKAMAELRGVDSASLEWPQWTKGEGSICLRVSPYDFIIDPNVDAFSLDKAAFMGRFYMVEKDAAERDDRFENNQGLPNLSTTKTANEEMVLDPAMRDREISEEHPMTMLCEVWFRRVKLKNGFTDADGNRQPGGYYPLVVTWAAGRTDKPLRVTLWPYDLEDDRGKRKYPFDVMVNLEVPGKLRGLSDCEIIESQQLALNRGEAITLTYADRVARQKLLTFKGAMDLEARDRVDGPEVGAIAEVEQKGQPLSETLIAVPVPPLQGEVPLLVQTTRENINRQSGVNEMAQGEGVQGDKTLGEVQIIANQSGARAAKEDAEFEAYLISTTDKLWQLECQFKYTGSRVKISLPPGPQGGGEPREVRIGDEHLLPAEISVVTGSSKLRNDREEVQSLSTALQILNGMGELQTVANPQGRVSALPLLTKLLQKLKVDTGDPALWDTDALKQKLAQEQMAQMQQMAAMAPQAATLGGPQGALPASSGEGTPGPSPSAPSPEEDQSQQNLVRQMLQAIDRQNPQLMDQLMQAHGINGGGN
jgi:hypothetical protein